MKCEYCDSEFEGKICPYCGAKAPEANSPQLVNAPPIQQSGYVDARPVAKAVTTKKSGNIRWLILATFIFISIAILCDILGNNKNDPSAQTHQKSFSAEITVKDTKIKAPKASTYFVDKKVEDVVQLFSSAGFENIRIKGNGELIIGFLHSEGDVESVSIGGETDFSKNDSFDKESLVIIRYYSYADEESIVAGYEEATPSETVVAGESSSPITESEISTAQNQTDTATAISSGVEVTTNVGTTEEITTDNTTAKEITTKVDPETTKKPALPMPVMQGTSLDTVVQVAKKYGLSQVYSDENWGNGTKMRPLSNKTGGLTLDIVYSTSTKQVLFGEIITFNNLSSSKEQKAFIIAMASVLCPSSDKDTVSNWVKSNVGSSKKTTIGGFVYEVDLGPMGNCIYDAGEKNWEEWLNSLE